MERAAALETLGDVEGAIAAYEAALARERTHPHLKTNAYLHLPMLVAMRRMARLYPRALEILDANKARLTFPLEHYQVHGCRALILHELGRVSEARIDAGLARAAAAKTHPGLRYHRDLGLVDGTDDAFGRRLAAIIGGQD